MKARETQEFAKQWVGVCEIFSKERKARLTSLDVSKADNKVKVFPNKSTTMDVVLADLPKAVQRLIKPNMPAKRFRVRLNQDGDNIDEVGPVTGVYQLKAAYLGPKQKDGSYKLLTKTYNQGTDKENSHDEFFCSYEFVDGAFRGMSTPAYWLHYKFEEIPEGEEGEGFTRFNTAPSPQATQLFRLQAWADAHGGVLDEDIVWPDDGIILETIEERVLDNDRVVNGIFENGYIKTVQPIETYESEDDEESEEEFDEKFSDKGDSLDKDDDDEEVVEVPAKTVKAPAKAKPAPSAKKVVAKAVSNAKKSSKNVEEDDSDL